MTGIGATKSRTAAHRSLLPVARFRISVPWVYSKGHVTGRAAVRSHFAILFAGSGALSADSRNFAVAMTRMRSSCRSSALTRCSP